MGTLQLSSAASLNLGESQNGVLGNGLKEVPGTRSVCFSISSPLSKSRPGCMLSAIVLSPSICPAIAMASWKSGKSSSTKKIRFVDQHFLFSPLFYHSLTH